MWAMLLHEPQCLNCKESNHYYDEVLEQSIPYDSKSEARKQLKEALGLPIDAEEKKEAPVK